MSAIIKAVLLISLVLPSAARAQASPDWFTCQQGRDCVVIDGTCSPKAVNTKSADKARAYFAEMSAMAECPAPPPSSAGLSAVCTEGICQIADTPPVPQTQPNQPAEPVLP